MRVWLQWVFLIPLVNANYTNKLMWIHDGTVSGLLSETELSAVILDAAESFSLTLEMVNNSLLVYPANDETTVYIMTISNCSSSDRLTNEYTPKVLRIQLMECSPVTTNGTQDLKLSRLMGTRRIPCLQHVLSRWLDTSLFGYPSSLLGSQLSPEQEWEECGGQILKPSDLNGKHLLLGSFIRPPFVFRLENEQDTYGGFCFEIIYALKDLYNFTFSVVLPKEDSGTGTRVANGSWNGLIGRLTRGEIDIGVGPFSVTHSRQEVIDFSVTFYEEPTATLIPPPTPDNHLWACTKPFQLSVWLALLTALSVLPFIPVVRSKWIPCRRNTTSLYRHCVQIYGVLLTQSGRRFRPQGDICWRLLVAVWCLSAVVLIHAYTGMLMSILTVPKLWPAINSLEDLPSSKFSWFVIHGTSLESLFLEADSGIFRVIGDGLRRQSNLAEFKNSSDVISRVINGTSVHINGRSILEYLIERDYLDHDHECRMSMAKKEFFKVSMAFAYPKGSPLQSIFNRKIMQMAESGLADYWMKKHWPSIDDRCSPNKAHQGKVDRQPRPLSLSELQSAFFLLIMGQCLTITTLLAEKLFYSFTSY